MGGVGVEPDSGIRQQRAGPELIKYGPTGTNAAAERRFETLPNGSAEPGSQGTGGPERDKDSVEAFLRHVLESILFPAGFPHECEVAFNQPAEQVLVQLSLPPRDVVPDVKAYKYVERSNEERVSARPAREIADIYRDTVGQVVVLALRAILAADEKLQRVGVNGHVRAVDPATGEWEYPCLISVDTTSEDFPREEALHNVDVGRAA